MKKMNNNNQEEMVMDGVKEEDLTKEIITK